MILKDRHVVVTGAGGFLGAAVVAAARREGARITLVDAVPVRGEADGVLLLDLTDAAATAQALRAIGPVDALFHLAGGFDMGQPSHDIPEAAWASMFKINVDTLRHAVTALVPGMIERGTGKIVTIGANAAQRGQAFMGAYCAAKAVVMRLTESLSGELKTKGININGVLPSIIDTPRNRADMPDADPGTWVAPEDLANVICFLGSDAARAVHGALIPVAGLI
jgi:NAD(P)-dependent dehydrogenase (short-subunit alcohol dehydrogenase family)